MLTNVSAIASDKVGVVELKLMTNKKQSNKKAKEDQLMDSREHKLMATLPEMKLAPHRNFNVGHLFKFNLIVLNHMIECWSHVRCEVVVFFFLILSES